MESTRDCLVVGAGIAGLLAARTLKSAGIRVSVLGKIRGAGVRMSTRCDGDATFDHGVVFCTVRIPVVGVVSVTKVARRIGLAW